MQHAQKPPGYQCITPVQAIKEEQLIAETVSDRRVINMQDAS